MKKRILLGVVLLAMSASASYATPPQDVKLSYDTSAKKLSVTITHASKDINHHYIRKYVITKNQDKPILLFRHRQDSPLEFTESVDLDAKPGDAIKVKVYCSDGGNAERELVVPKPEKKDTESQVSDDTSAKPSEPMPEAQEPEATMKPKGSGY